MNIMELVSDLELGTKDASEIHLAIVWDDTLASVQNYQYLDLENSTYDRVTITGVEKTLRQLSTGRDIPVLAVKPLVKVKEKR